MQPRPRRIGESGGIVNLQIGQRFKCKAFDRLVGSVEFDRGAPFVDFGRLKLDHGWERYTPDYLPSVTAVSTETKEGGWSRRVEVALPVRAPSLVDRVFVVTSAKSDGGGYGHGPHDRYPDGWSVEARQEGEPKTRVRFRQSGCFCDVVPSELIEVLP